MTNINKQQVEKYGKALYALRNEEASSDISRKNKIEAELSSIEVEREKNSKISKRRLPSSNSQKNYNSEYSYAFRNYLRKGHQIGLNGSESPEQMDSTGYNITDEMKLIIDENLHQSSIRSFCNVQIVSGNYIDLPSLQNTPQASWGDGTTVAPITDVFQKKVLQVYNLTAQPKVTQRMLDDSSFDIESWLAEMLSDIFEDMENNAFINGTGINQPTGILSYKSDVINRVVNNDKTKITAESILALQSALLPKYEKKDETAFVMSKTILASIRLLKDSSGRYLFDSGVLNGSQDSLLGMPIVIASQMPTISAGNDILVYGNLNKGYCIVDRQDITILRDPFMARPYVVFFATKRTGGDVINADALKILSMPAN